MTLERAIDELLQAYRQGLFPMGDRRGRVQWYCPDPRAILEPQAFKAPRSLRQRIRRGGYEIRINTCFERVIRCCADRPTGTWISPEILRAYEALHHRGCAHSIETYYGDELAGGLYGVSIGGAFFGESMFTLITDGSKLALVALVERMISRGMPLLDIQFLTQHLSRFGAREVPRREYLRRLQEALQMDVSFV